MQPQDVKNIAVSPAQRALSRPFTFDRVVRIIIGLGIVAALWWIVDRLSDVLLPFVVAWLMAYMLEPFVQLNRRVLHLRGRFVAILLTLLEVAVVLTALGIIFIPWLNEEIHQVGEIISRYTRHHGDVPLVPESVHQFLRQNINLDEISSQINGQDLEGALKWLGSIITDSINFVVSIVSWLIALLYLVFIMIDYDKLIHGARAMVPRHLRRLVFGIAGDVSYNMNHYFRGQALVSLCVGIIFAIGFAIIGLPMGVMLGLLIGCMNMVPYLQLVSIPITVVLCLMYAAGGGGDFWTIAGECLLLYCVCQLIQDLFLTPKIMGKYMGLNPAIILLSLSIWGSLLGIIGMIIALPLTTLLISYYKRYILGSDPRAVTAIDEALESPTEY